MLDANYDFICTPMRYSYDPPQLRVSTDKKREYKFHLSKKTDCQRDMVVLLFQVH